MKKIILAPFVFILWILYLLISMNERNRYLHSLDNGHYCYKSEDIGLCHYDPTRKPEKDYATWREFWTKFGYFKSI